jgi:hypothetical protein
MINIKCRPVHLFPQSLLKEFRAALQQLVQPLRCPLDRSEIVVWMRARSASAAISELVYLSKGDVAAEQP